MIFLFRNKIEKFLTKYIDSNIDMLLCLKQQKRNYPNQSIDYIINFKDLHVKCFEINGRITTINYILHNKLLPYHKENIILYLNKKYVEIQKKLEIEL